LSFHDNDNAHLPSDRLIFGKFFMIYSAMGLAVIGVGAGLAFRWKVLLPIIVLLPLAAITFSASRGFSYKDAAIVTFVAEGMLQAGYVVGLMTRSIAGASLRRGAALDLFKGRCHPRDRQTPPTAGAGEAP
jgi:hypothetical protein